MHVEESDERDNQWERHRNTFRVYIFAGHGEAHSVSTFDIADATFSEARTWAEDKAVDRMYSLALVSTDERGRRGLAWLIGGDANDVP
ncbi:hypothetical protein QFZ30_000055 [Arthrobacter pascens]|uniref:hypothetical protein n=1 Tax=Arthrobacter pascens TaxID=1677 RepID=UPI002793FCF3|nr:hypothetical protein [Arthrobacter pascens]MDQ0676673.1 hypothetical protein [Arthrobacter pascens]